MTVRDIITFNAGLLTSTVVAAGERFGVSFDELHNDSTSVKFCGQYRRTHPHSIRGRRPPWITYGHSKDHRPDLKQLLFILTASVDAGAPVQFRCKDGNTNDTRTHVETWDTLLEVSGRKDFLYVADSKLCTRDNVEHIDSKGGRFVTVLPRSRSEDKRFREWIQSFEPDWEQVWDCPNPRKKYGPRNICNVFRHPAPSREGGPVTWVWSSPLKIHQEQRRQEKIQRATEDLAALRKQLEGPRPRLRSPFQIEERIESIVKRLRVTDYVRAWVIPFDRSKFLQEKPGRPGRQTRYRKETQAGLSIAYEVDEAAVEYDKKSDGMYPLLTNDRSLTPLQVLEAHNRQPTIEKRFQQAKSVHEIAPVFLKNESWIEALFFLYFLALLLQALIERELRRAMSEEGIEALAFYPERRACKNPTARRIFQLFSYADRCTLSEQARIVQLLEPELTDLQKEILRLLKIPRRAYGSAR